MNEQPHTPALTPEITSLLRRFATSRPHLMKATAIAGGLVALGTLAPGTIAGLALGQAAAADEGDLGILNYALTLEHFEDALYRGLGSGQLANMMLSYRFKSTLISGNAMTYVKAFGDHEHTHVVALTQTIRKLGGTPVAEQPCYNLFALLGYPTDASSILKVLVTVEDLGAAAYLGAAPLVKSPDVLTAAVEIHTVEAEHATAWRALAGYDIVPFAFATPMTKTQVLATVGPLLSC